MAEKSMFEVGLENRRAVLVAEHVDRSLAQASDFAKPMQQLVTEYCWGEVWTRSVLTNKQRSLNNLCMIAALNRGAEFELHVRGALRNGCTKEEIRDALIQVAIYAGIPAGVEAFRIARKVLTEEGVLGAQEK